VSSNIELRMGNGRGGIRVILDDGFWMKKSGDRDNLGFGVEEELIGFFVVFSGGLRLPATG